MNEHVCASVILLDEAEPFFSVEPFNGTAGVLEVLRSQRWTVAATAREIEVKPAHLQHVVRGRVTPCPEAREKLPQLLSCSIEELFTPEVIAQPFWHKRKQYVSGGAK